MDSNKTSRIILCLFLGIRDDYDQPGQLLSLIQVITDNKIILMGLSPWVLKNLIFMSTFDKVSVM